MSASCGGCGSAVSAVVGRDAPLVATTVGTGTGSDGAGTEMGAADPTAGAVGRTVIPSVGGRTSEVRDRRSEIGGRRSGIEDRTSGIVDRLSSIGGAAAGERDTRRDGSGSATAGSVAASRFVLAADTAS